MSWQDFDDLLYGPSGGPPPRIRYERNAEFLTWIMDWIGVNRRPESLRTIRAMPKVTVPSRYRTVPAKVKSVYRGIKLSQPVMDQLLKKGFVTLRRNGLVSYTPEYGIAKDFAILGPSVVIEKTLHRKDVFAYLPNVLDDLAWMDAKNEKDWKEARSELNWVARERELLLHDDDPHWRRIDLVDCVTIDDGRNWKGVSGKSMARRLGLSEAIQPHLTGAFKAWFKGSKVVDHNGNPLVCYHGTFANFSAFDRSRGFGTNRLGFWFDAAPETPNFFADGPGGNVMPCFLSIKRPLIFESEPLWHEDATRLDQMAQEEDWDAFNLAVHGDEKTRPKIDRRDAYDHLLSSIDSRITGHFDSWNERARFLSSAAWESKVEAFKQDAISEGYDGILLKDTFADGGSRGGKLTDWWIAFHPNQIKSTISAKRFDPTSDDITESF